MNPFDSYMLNKVRRLKGVRTRYAATGERALGSASCDGGRVGWGLWSDC